jgi:hypothetical protein
MLAADAPADATLGEALPAESALEPMVEAEAPVDAAPAMTAPENAAGVDRIEADALVAAPMAPSTEETSAQSQIAAEETAQEPEPPTPTPSMGETADSPDAMEETSGAAERPMAPAEDAPTVPAVPLVHADVASDSAHPTFTPSPAPAAAPDDFMTMPATPAPEIAPAAEQTAPVSAYPATSSEPPALITSPLAVDSLTRPVPRESASISTPPQAPIQPTPGAPNMPAAQPTYAAYPPMPQQPQMPQQAAQWPAAPSMPLPPTAPYGAASGYAPTPAPLAEKKVNPFLIAGIVIVVAALVTCAGIGVAIYSLAHSAGGSTSVTPIASPSPAATATSSLPVGFAAFSDNNGLYAVAVPASWTHTPTSAQTISLDVFSEPRQQAAFEIESVNAASSGQDPKTLDDLFIKTVASNGNVTNKRGPSSVTVGATQWTQESGDVTIRAIGATHVVVLATTHAEHTMLIAYLAPAKTFSGLDTQYFQPMLANFRFLK